MSFFPSLDNSLSNNSILAGHAYLLLVEVIHKCLDVIELHQLQCILAFPGIL